MDTGKLSQVLAERVDGEVRFDPGKENIVGQIAALRSIKENPGAFKKPIDDLYKLVTEEFSSLTSNGLGHGLVISKSYNSGAVEVNYQKTWKEGVFGIPIFSIEDFYAGTEAIMGAIRSMGIVPTISYDANILISPGLGTLDENDSCHLGLHGKGSVKSFVGFFRPQSFTPSPRRDREFTSPAA